MTRRILLLVVLAVVGVSAYGYFAGDDAAAPDVRTMPISRGNVVDAVQATGTVQPVTTVTVGSQVSGVISWIGPDFNSLVREGEVIARIEPSILQAQVEQARANLAKVEADVIQREAGLADSRTKLARAERLAVSGLLAVTDLEAAKLAVAMDAASLASIRAQVTQAQASVIQARVNLNHATITAPIDGIVIQRSVDVGQTVAASLSSPTIFLIAADLADMQVSASIDEGDISDVVADQPVTLKVDAFPEETFAGTVRQVRLQPIVVSNVTTYSAIIDVENRGMRLKPGMTANVDIEVARRDDVLRAPAAALRFRPTADMFAALGQPEPAPATPAARGDVANTSGRAMSAPQVARLADAAGTGAGSGQIWILENGQIQPARVRVGLSDGSYTELLSDDLEPGQLVVTTITLPNAATALQPANSVFGAARGGGFGGQGVGRSR